MKIPKSLSYEELDHDKNKFPALSPDYKESDMGKGYDLTMTLFGYQLGNDEIIKIIEVLNQHLIFSLVNDQLKTIKK